MLGAIGVVFGDIGTSPLYALRETVSMAAGGEAAADGHVLGALSVMVWTLALLIGLKYVTILLRADNGGEGGLFALRALAESRDERDHRGRGRVLLWLAVIGAALLYGDGVITPAISVLSAMEGLTPIHQGTHAHWVVVASAFIVLGIFLTQRLGSGRIGWLAGPIMVGWFLVIGVLGVRAVLSHPEVLQALSPMWGMQLMLSSPSAGFLMLGGVVLCVTGGEALYADMGHFGRRAITLAWWLLVCPSLLAAYFGQGAIMLAASKPVGNPFFALVPDGMLIPMVVLATIAAIIASQAIISGAFSMTRQLTQQGLLPPMRVVHTSPVEGQIYLPGVNFLMAGACVLVLLLFGSAESLAGAYGLSVTGVMLVTTILFTVVARRRWRWSWWALGPLTGLLVTIETLFLAANATKIATGGWLPLLLAVLVLGLITTWKRGLSLVNRGRLEDGLPLDRFIEGLGDETPRFAGTGVFFGRMESVTPVTIRKLQRHLDGLPETLVIVHLHALGVPRVPYQQRLRLVARDHGVWTASLRFGYLQSADVPSMMREAADRGVPIDPRTVTYWVRRDQVALATDHRTMSRWRVAVFAYLLRNATVLPDMLDLPPRRTVEIGMRATI